MGHAAKAVVLLGMTGLGAAGAPVASACAWHAAPDRSLFKFYDVGKAEPGPAPADGRTWRVTLKDELRGTYQTAIVPTDSTVIPDYQGHTCHVEESGRPAAPVKTLRCSRGDREWVRVAHACARETAAPGSEPPADATAVNEVGVAVFSLTVQCGDLVGKP